ncbi:lytic polysaccharide monooxygenase [Patellaria atrata CBS 101060]|uniref:AA9 family lytic polysaccharide monooxygenase n=1 Tax=Patellaria atrata CBS 101060 TaxID=1346257 RepID=A0A9P4VP68_9PEZI|nr:lytic polysaccharide monooxygenase [Patellaria atrata CBS 101060]
MKYSIFATLALAALGQAHCIAQRISVNGQDQGQLNGIRVPSSNNPIQNVQDSAMACNKGFVNPVSTNVINIPAGARVGAWWQHVIGGPQGPNDRDNPIAASHKGPAIVYLAKVSNAGTAGTSGLQWFKIAEDGLDGSGQWGVDRMIQNNGWQYFTMPSCVAPGQYLMRVELIALHSAYTQGQAQFYIACANINVTGGGSGSAPTVSFPGAYQANDPGIMLNIYSGTPGVPNNGGKPYKIPGPAVMQC